ncbi:putative peptidoglycan glycosyltransferase FtsW [wastewater metagenome]|uniref:peptidoglycan glycosyltransferase n=2 Tax=unclassified sequences TaxID=12908 RepID=A0A5B8RAK5_9ZZZZ|nr:MULTISPECIES: putative lipid II flippase FtsW [Arhodomonas]MCS4504705.1 putative lipid II flippase FtsW [Arhodomonas aquaeolei]QEA04978.1 putative peptidoglycan glycosyltransferase FtsW [uncultured organism]
MIERALARFTPQGRDIPAALDWPLVATVGVLLVFGLVMVASASMAVAERETGAALSLFYRQGFFTVMGVIVVTLGLMLVRTTDLEAAGPGLLGVSLLLLVVVLLPGVGREVNGAVRWLPLGVVNLQVSEVAKLGVLIYLAGYVVRRGEALRTRFSGFLVPVAILALVAGLLLMEPDFGGAAVILATGAVVLFLGGAPLSRMLLLAALGVIAAAGLIVSSPYRWERLTGFLNPWADPFDSGFQLTQALIAVGRGGWFGVGLGNSVQKLFYLPEAHTDFLFSVLAEELGVLGVTAVVALFTFMVWRILRIGVAAFNEGRPFGAYVCWGVGFWLGAQAFINMGVNLGLLPTKGLTLPLMSYGGSSLVVTLAAVGLVLRVDWERRAAAAAATDEPGRVAA